MDKKVTQERELCEARLRSCGGRRALSVGLPNRWLPSNPDWLMKDQTCKSEAAIKSWFKMGLSTRGSILGTSFLPFCLLCSVPSCLHPFFLSLLVVLIYLNLFIYGCTGSGNTTCTISHLKNKQKLTYDILFWKFSHVSVLVQAFRLVGQISFDW